MRQKVLIVVVLAAACVTAVSFLAASRSALADASRPLPTPQADEIVLALKVMDDTALSIGDGLDPLPTTTTSAASTTTVITTTTIKVTPIPGTHVKGIPKQIILTNNHDEFQHSWDNVNPGVGKLFFGDQEMIEFVRTFRPDVFPKFNELIRIEQADLFRYLAMYFYGGIYADVDVVCKEPIETWPRIAIPQLLPPDSPDAKPVPTMAELDFMIGVEFSTPQDSNPMQFVQWTLASSRGNPLFLHVFEYCWQMVSILPRGVARAVVKRTGPIAFTRAVLDFIAGHARPQGMVEGYPKALLPPKELAEMGQTLSLFTTVGELRGVILPYRSFGYHASHRPSFRSPYDHLVEHMFRGSWQDQV
eukprot:m.60664 g.60664  ORF g.60664 m.60664 type:complete len:361 (+) comp13675_c0_seq2:159-1241(+)